MDATNHASILQYKQVREVTKLYLACNIVRKNKPETTNVYKEIQGSKEGNGKADSIIWENLESSESIDGF